MIKVEVHLEEEQLEQLTAHLEHFGKTAFPEASNAFKMAARRIQTAWQGWAMGGELDGAEPIKNPSPNLVRSIKIEQHGNFETEIYTESPYMTQIQNGQEKFDMKETHPYGQKSRVSKKGVPYLIVPFRWGTPNDKGGKRARFSNFMETDIHSLVKGKKKFGRSLENGGWHYEKNFAGEEVARAEYDWGDRLEAGGNMNGLVAFPDAKGSTYFTFRIISAKSPRDSWIRKGVPANDVVGALERKYTPEVAEIVGEGLKADLGIS